MQSPIEFTAENLPVPGTSKTLTQIWAYEVRDMYQQLRRCRHGLPEDRYFAFVHAMTRYRLEFLDAILRPHSERERQRQLASAAAKLGSAIPGVGGAMGPVKRGLR